MLLCESAISKVLSQPYCSPRFSHFFSIGAGFSRLSTVQNGYFQSKFTGAIKPMDPLGQLYLTCTFLGWGFIIACFALGQIDHGGGGHSDGGHMGHDGIGGHAGGGHGAGHGAGHGHGNGHGTHGVAREVARGVAEGAHGAHGLEAHGGGHVTHGPGGHGGHGGGHSNGHGSGHGHGHGHGQNGDDAHTSVNPVVRPRENKLFFTVISIISPMSLSLFAGFFGSVGFITWHYMPWLGYVTLIPAIVCGAMATEFLKRAMSTLVTKLNSSSLTKKAEAIGRIAEVNTPISDGRLGEVSYVIGTTRFNSSAKSANPEDSFVRGSKVMIIETEGPVVYVEPARDIDLELM
jgi:membrane protein implicated in regulation of membrane protease activity